MYRELHTLISKYKIHSKFGDGSYLFSSVSSKMSLVCHCLDVHLCGASKNSFTHKNKKKLKRLENAVAAHTSYEKSHILLELKRSLMQRTYKRPFGTLSSLLYDGS